LVEVAVPESVQNGVAAHSREAIFLTLGESNGQIAPEAAQTIAEACEKATAMVFGPGMGLSDGTVDLTHRLLGKVQGAHLKGAVFDADALNALSRIDRWWETEAPLVLTPHPGEMSRLTGIPVAEIQQNRVAVCRERAERWGKTVVLKGAGTIIASPGRDLAVNPTGGPNMATAGAGDVLSGIIGSLLSQGLEPHAAAVAGVYWHGRAGDILRKEHGDAGTLAGDIAEALPAGRLSILNDEKRSR
jgi:NAD(P)H-hydrate epimerase